MKLITKYDRYHIHKICGLISFVNFIYRYLYLFPNYFNLGIDKSNINVILMLIHLITTISALKFPVPRKNIGLIIGYEFIKKTSLYTTQSFLLYLLTFMKDDCLMYHLFIILLFHYKKEIEIYFYVASLSQLFPFERSGDMAFNTLIVIQTSAFLKTLFKKKIITKKTHDNVYLLCKMISLSYILTSAYFGQIVQQFIRTNHFK